MDKFIETVYKYGDIKKYRESDLSEYKLSEEQIGYYIAEKIVKYPRYNIGDIVFVNRYKYKNGNDGENHLFVIIGNDNYAVPITYFCMLISSNLDKLKYKKNVMLKKNSINKLDRNSIVKTDYVYDIDSEDINFYVGCIPINLVNKYRELYLHSKEAIYE